MTKLSVAKNRGNVAALNAEYVPRRTEVGFSMSSSPMYNAISPKSPKKGFLSPIVGKNGQLDSLSQHRTSASIAAHTYGVTPLGAPASTTLSPRAGPMSVREVPASFIASQKVPKLIDSVQHQAPSGKFQMKLLEKEKQR